MKFSTLKLGFVFLLASVVGSCKKEPEEKGVNKAPTANAGADIMVTAPLDSTELRGYGADPDGSIVAFNWKQLSGPPANMINAQAANAKLKGLQQAVYIFELTVTDNGGLSARDTMNVNVNSLSNQPPTADAGTDLQLLLPVDSTELVGRATDPDGLIVSYAWTQLSGPASVLVVNANRSVTKIKNFGAGVFIFEFRVVDDGGLSAADTVMVRVTAANLRPLVNAGPDRIIAIPNDSTELSGSASDPDGTITSYSWSKISGPGLFTIVNANSPVTKIKDLVQGVYVFQLNVTDNGGLVANDQVTVTLRDSIRENILPIALAGPDQVLSLPISGFDLAGSGSDPDGQIVSYEWIVTAYYSMLGQSAVLQFSTANARVINPPEGFYNCRLKVTDNRGGFSFDEVLVRVVSAGCPCYPDPCDAWGNPCDPWDY